MVFSVVMYGYESWTIKKADHQRIDAFELWCWRRLLRVPWTARRSNQSVLKEISPKHLLLKLKLQYFGQLMQRAELFEKTMDYYSAITKNAFESVLTRWTKLEPTIQSEVSQKEKHQYNILMRIYGI